MQLIVFILQTLATFLTFALLVRFAMQWAQAPFRNPIGHFIITVTDWMVRPARRVIPSAWGQDLPSIVLAWLIQAIYLGILHGLRGASGGVDQIGTVALLALFETANVACNLAIGVVIISALLSWINPHAPLAPVVNALAAPMLRPFQRIIPLIGSVDLSPVVLFFTIKLIELGLLSLRDLLL